MSVLSTGNSASENVVPLLDLKAQYRSIEAEVMAAMQRVCTEQKFILGENVQLLEDEVAAYSQCAYGIGVSSGTDALLVALMALGVGADDEVITTPYTFFATGGAIARVGARPLFCDIDPASYNLSPHRVAELIEKQCAIKDSKLINQATGGIVKALLPVHLFGQMADMHALMELAQENHLKVIEDAAQAIGAENARGRRAGSIGDVGCFSFFPSKNLGAFGDAGMCVTNDAELAERLKVLRVHGGKPKYHHAVIGGNFRLDEIQAAILRVKLRYLDQWTQQRQRNAAYYDEAFSSNQMLEWVSPPVALPGYRHIYNQYVIRAERRDELRSRLASANVGTEIYYPIPLDRQKCFDYLNNPAGAYPESEKAANETLALPIYPELTESQRQYVIDTISQFYRS
jgi:dTDP-4-amino-4,6-dideoxygalactose transaminase